MFGVELSQQIWHKNAFLLNKLLNYFIPFLSEVVCFYIFNLLFEAHDEFQEPSELDILILQYLIL